MCRFFVIFVGLFLFHNVASGDVVTLDSGSRIFGIIKAIENRALTIKTQELDTLTVSFDAVSSFSTDNVVYLQLKDKRLISGKVALEKSGTVCTELYFPPVTEPVGSIRSTRDQIVELSTEPPMPYRHKWSGKALAGGALYSGNTKRSVLDLLLSGHLDIYHYKKLDKELDFEGEYNFYKDDGIISTNDAWEQITFTKYFSRRWSFYALEALSFSEASNLRFRSQVELGPGYRLVDLDRFQIALRAGFGRIDSWYTTSPKHQGYFAIIPAALLRFEHKSFTITDYTSWAGSLSNPNEYLIYSDFRVALPITSRHSFVFRNEIEYNSTPALNKEKLDTKTTANYMISF